MTVLTDAQIIEDIIEAEGGYVNDPADRGGATNWGITIATLRVYRNNPDLTEKDVQRLTKDEARLIYRREYITRPKFDSITNDILRAQIIDFGVNSGPSTAAKALQKVLGVKADGDIGILTLAALRRMGYAKANNLLMAERIMHLAKAVRGRPANARFIVGWCTRALAFMI